MAGPFDKYLGPWFNMRESANVEDRREDPWPWHPVGAEPNELTRMSPTLERTAYYAIDNLIPPKIPAVTALGRELGASDVEPISKEELLKFLINIESMNPDPSPPVATRELKDVIKRR